MSALKTGFCLVTPQANRGKRVQTHVQKISCFDGVVCKILPMNTITVPIGAGRTDLCKLLEKVEAGAAGGF